MNPYEIEQLMSERKKETERISREGWRMPKRKKHLRLFSFLKQAFTENQTMGKNRIGRECTDC